MDTGELYKAYLATAEAASERRAKMNAWMLSVNSALIGVHAAISKDNAQSGLLRDPSWLWTIAFAGIVVCIAWLNLIKSYRDLNKAKFAVIAEMEKNFDFKPFTLERELYKAYPRISFSYIELGVPVAMALVYAILVVKGNPLPPP